MARRRTNTHAQARRRLPFVAIIDREEPFCRVDSEEIEAECRRITNGAEFLKTMARAGRGYQHVVHFGSQHQADAFHLWCHRNDIARRPVPRFGPSPEEKAAFRQACLLWGFRTGAVRRIVQAFRNTQGSLLQQQSAAQNVAHSYVPPQGGDVAMELVHWAMENYHHWFFHQRPPARHHWEDPNEYPPQKAYPHTEDD
jgi:hypothetical protein